MYCTVYLVRHGETDWNVAGKWQGHTDIPLNERGREQALDLRKKLEGVDFAAAYSSDLSRAHETASLVMGDRPITLSVTEHLRELSMGSWEGCVYHDFVAHFQGQGRSVGEITAEEYLSHQLHPEIENYAEAYSRVKNWLISQVDAHLGSTLLVASHGGILRALMYQLDFRSDCRWAASNCSYLKLHIYPTGQVSLMEHEGIHITKEDRLLF